MNSRLGDLVEGTITARDADGDDRRQLSVAWQPLDRCELQVGPAALRSRRLSVWLPPSAGSQVLPRRPDCLRCLGRATVRNGHPVPVPRTQTEPILSQLGHSRLQGAFGGRLTAYILSGALTPISATRPPQHQLGSLRQLQPGRTHPRWLAQLGADHGAVAIKEVKMLEVPGHSANDGQVFTDCATTSGNSSILRMMVISAGRCQQRHVELAPRPVPRRSADAGDAGVAAPA